MRREGGRKGWEGLGGPERAGKAWEGWEGPWAPNYGRRIFR